MTPEQVDIVKSAARSMRGMAAIHQIGSDAQRVNRETSIALEALLSEREELLKDKARLDWIESQKVIKINKVAFEDKWSIDSVQSFNYGSPEEVDGDLRAAIDAAMKGDT